MKSLLLFFIFLILSNCNKPQTVVICGNHVCVNKAEAEQYFEENLTIEVKIIDTNKKKTINLVELNLNDNSKINRKISIKQKFSTKDKVKILTNNEIKKIKKNIKNKKKIAKTINQKKKIETTIIKEKNKIKKKEVKKIAKRNTNKKKDKILDVCTIVKNCSIDEISKYLLKQGKEKGFPDITVRE
tara:strand:+ start:999 stop:1556 length:558 start_codon:yes stop_codon:yes gene_type:complete